MFENIIPTYNLTSASLMQPLKNIIPTYNLPSASLMQSLRNIIPTYNLPSASLMQPLKNIIPTYNLPSASLMQPLITTTAALAHTYQIELVSTLVLCAHLCALFFWWRRPSSSSSSGKKSPQTPECDPRHAEYVWCFDIQGVRTRGTGESETRADGNDGCSGNVSCDWVPGEKGDWVPGEDVLGKGGLRRSERARTPTRRFEESWFKGRLPCLGDALSSDEE